jgi:hypothetical protein
MRLLQRSGWRSELSCSAFWRLSLMSGPALGSRNSSLGEGSARARTGKALAVVPNERTRSMNRYGLAVLAGAVASALAFGPSALAQTLHPAGPTQVPAPEQAPPAPAITPDQPSQTGAVPMPTSPEVQRLPVYRICLRAAKRKGLRGAKRRSFVTRCRLGREPVTR